MAIKFDLSEIGSGATVNSATLRLYKHGNRRDFKKSSTYTVHVLTTDWEETSTNWKSPWSSDGGDFSQTAIDTYEYDGSYNGWIEYTLTDAVQDIVDGTADNCGFIVADMNGDDVSNAETTLDQESHIYSKEGSDESRHPQLVVDYDITEIITGVPGKNTMMIHSLLVSDNKVLFNSPSDQTVSLSLYSVCGRLVLHRTDLKVKRGRNRYDLGAVLSKGVYFLKFYD